MNFVYFDAPEGYDLFLAGDFCPITDNLNRELIIDLSLAEIMGKARMRAVNLECPLTSNSNQIMKTGPALKAMPSSVDLLSKLGINLVNLANNHMMDYGLKGALDTISTLEKAGIKHTGIGKKEQETFLVVKIRDVKIAFVSFTENEFSTLSRDRWSAHPLDPYLQLEQIRNASEVADFVVVQYHGGAEGYPYPSPGQKRYARFLTELGAAMVICHHSHCYSGYEVYKGKMIFYGLGNLYFPKAGEPESFYHGLGLCISFDEAVKANVICITYDAISGCLQSETSECGRIKNDIYELNEVINSDERLQSAWDDFCEKTMDVSLSAFRKMTFINRLLKKIGIRKNPKSRVNLGLMNRIRCETHRERLITVLQRILSENIGLF